MAGDRLNLDATRSRGLPISGRGAGFFVGQFTGRTGAAPAALRRRGGPQPGSLDGAHRSGRAGGYHQDPPTTLLLPRRTADPLGPPPHFASSPALALGSPVQWRPGTIASPSISGMTAATSPLTPIRPTERPRQLDFVHLGGVGEDIGELSVNCGWGFSVGQPQHEVRRFGHVSNFCTKSSLGSAGIDPQLWHSNVGDVSRVIRISVSGHFQTIDRTTAGRLQTVHGFIASQQLTFVSPCVSRRAASVASLSGPMGSSTSCIVSGRGN